MARVLSRCWLRWALATTSAPLVLQHAASCCNMLHADFAHWQRGTLSHSPPVDLLLPHAKPHSHAFAPADLAAARRDDGTQRQHRLQAKRPTFAAALAAKYNDAAGEKVERARVLGRRHGLHTCAAAVASKG